ncbi:hypothetical protein M427DRAFT_162873 [Gonapodya prolifera JEL478]|uniref:Uncharacterized protein n=1 Tax=Gonapodya prolifera (strain JEL478) TaxID=1344416 RepID=A0A139AZC3_GONPJ|nr:hypothetical protein M427DRAFT_162873 [Gonapodya prolifera JEL478]|eukprot:KXS22050.1 hypothetical protein M427DRAFT_162873 [Gonapodya prolifera JEL478]
MIREVTICHMVIFLLQRHMESEVARRTLDICFNSLLSLSSVKWILVPSGFLADLTGCGISPNGGSLTWLTSWKHCSNPLEGDVSTRTSDGPPLKSYFCPFILLKSPELLFGLILLNVSVAMGWEALISTPKCLRRHVSRVASIYKSNSQNRKERLKKRVEVSFLKCGLGHLDWVARAHQRSITLHRSRKSHRREELEDLRSASQTRRKGAAGSEREERADLSGAGVVAGEFGGRAERRRTEGEPGKRA